MERNINIEEVRNFLSVADKQFVQGGIAIQKVEFIRNEDNSLKRIVMHYNERIEIEKEVQE